MRSRSIVNLLSLSRILIGLGFVLAFQEKLLLVYVSVALYGLALTTDLLDGFAARRLRIASIHGRLWDSLGDKAFYIGIIVAFNSHGLLSPLLSWGLLVREVALYITRILYIENLPKVEQIRPFTNWHGYFMHLTITLGLASIYGSVKGISLDLYTYIQATATLALLFGLASIVRFCKLN
jgi:phosphatidylglycerophosphate synthase